jgi:hypothetical protein
VADEDANEVCSMITSQFTIACNQILNHMWFLSTRKTKDILLSYVDATLDLRLRDWKMTCNEKKQFHVREFECAYTVIF